MPSLNYFVEYDNFKISNPRKVSAWIKCIIKREKGTLNEVNFIFCSDEYLLDLNMQYLNHTTFTDIITFDNSDGEEALEGDIFISIDRVTENANKFKRPFTEELHRVMIHGILHLLGYSDKKPADKIVMRKKENTALSLF